MMSLENGSTLQIALLVSALWAVTPIVQKSALQKVPWRILFFATAITQSVIFASVFLFYNKQFLSEWNQTDLKTVITYSLVLTFLGAAALCLFYYILSTRNTFEVILITSSYFIVTIFLNAILFKQPLNSKQILAIILVFIAILLTQTV